MKKIASQLIGAAAVVATAAAGLAYAQTAEKPASTAGTVYEGGVNNGSTYVRSNQLGNASEAERPTPNTTRQDRNATSTRPATTTSSSASDTPATNDMNGSTATVTDRNNSNAGSAYSSNYGNSANADGTLAARADRN